MPRTRPNQKVLQPVVSQILVTDGETASSWLVCWKLISHGEEAGGRDVVMVEEMVQN